MSFRGVISTALPANVETYLEPVVVSRRDDGSGLLQAQPFDKGDSLCRGGHLAKPHSLHRSSGYLPGGAAIPMAKLELRARSIAL